MLKFMNDGAITCWIATLCSVASVPSEGSAPSGGVLFFSSSIATEKRVAMSLKCFVTNISAAVVEDGTTAKFSVREFF